MQCIHPIRIKKNLDPSVYPDGLEVPCGKCIACRIVKRKEWTLRMIHERDSWSDAVFVTLTYNDEHLPPNRSLVKRDLQNFFKRLRKTLSHADRKIKYFACGEYGDENSRPHYHAIIFGLSLRPEDKILVVQSWPYASWDVPQILQNSFGLAEVDSMRYVAQYIDKKFTGDKAETEYKMKGREPVFRITSNGLGKEFVINNAEQLTENETITLNGVKHSFPRYYIKKLELENSSFRKEKALEASEKIVKYYTGIDGLTVDQFVKIDDKSAVRSLELDILKSRKQREKNLNARVALKTNKL